MENPQIFVLGICGEKRFANHVLDLRRKIPEFADDCTHRLLFKAIRLSKHDEIRRGVIAAALEFWRSAVCTPNGTVAVPHAGMANIRPESSECSRTASLERISAEALSLKFSKKMNPAAIMST